MEEVNKENDCDQNTKTDVIERSVDIVCCDDGTFCNLF